MPTIDPKQLKPHHANEEIYEEREDPQFTKSIRENGILEPLVITSKNVIISGIRRWMEALKIGLRKVPYRVENPKDEIRAIIEYNRYRQKTPRELYNEFCIIKAREKPKAEERMLAGEPSAKIDRGSVRDKASEDLNVSSGKLHQITYVYQRQGVEGAKPIIERLDRNQISVNQAFEEIKKMDGKYPDSFVCGGCQQEYGDSVLVTVKLCPFCAEEFKMFCREKRECLD